MNKYLVFAGAALTLIALTALNHCHKELSLSERINSNPAATWKAGENSYFKGRTDQEVATLMGTLETPPSELLPIKQITPLSSIPESFDSREYWPNCESIREVRDQSTCGSCWAFGAVEAMSDRICIASGQKLQTRISAEDLLTCCGISCGMGCNGGYPHSAWTHFKNKGISTGWLYNTSNWCRPYTFAPCDHHTQGKYEPCGPSQPTPKCEKKCADGYPTEYKKDLHYAKTVYGVSKKVEEIQTEIMTNGPVEVSLSVYSDFLEYKSGVYHHVEGKYLGGHAVKMIGWGVQNGTSYWTVANSWNEDWGDKGFFKIKRGTNECGIEGNVVAGIPKIN